MASSPNFQPSRRYSNIAIFLHWSLAALIGLTAVQSWIMTGAAPHQGLLVVILLLSFVRLGWRLTHPLLPLPSVMVGWEKGVARIAHVVFYAAMIGIPLLALWDGRAHADVIALLALLVMHVSAALKHSYIRRTASEPRAPRAQETYAL